jgi:hypothetical protein
MGRPSFFLSSTIYDFADLRSAVKYYLEQQGCSVFASEFNDFPKPLDSHSYDACIAALKKADYFVLFIGGRVGGWFDKDNRISITQQEYREAYRLHQQGRSKLINFVRADIWRLKEDRKELANFLKTVDVDPGMRSTIQNYPSKTVADPDFICDFIAEVCRNHETKEALASKKPMPTGNWVHNFATFRDVIDVIQTQAFSGVPVEHVALRRLLCRELEGVLQRSLMKFGSGSVHSPLGTVLELHRRHQFNVDGDINARVTIGSSLWNRLTMFAFHLNGLQYDTLILQRALESATFLDFDPGTGTMNTTPAYDALFKLHEQIRLLHMAKGQDTMKVVFDNGPQQRGGNDKDANIAQLKLLRFLSAMDRWVNIIELSKALILHLRGTPLHMPTLRPMSPFSTMNEQLQAEQVTPADVDCFLAE